MTLLATISSTVPSAAAYALTTSGAGSRKYHQAPRPATARTVSTQVRAESGIVEIPVKRQM
jgi:hypothetical protein